MFNYGINDGAHFSTCLSVDAFQDVIPKVRQDVHNFLDDNLLFNIRTPWGNQVFRFADSRDDNVDVWLLIGAC